MKRRIAAQLLLCVCLGCADFPTAGLPLATELPVDDVRLGMTFGELRQARPDVRFVPDTLTVAEELERGRFHYAFTSQRRNRTPGRRSRLVYIDREDEEIHGGLARRRWDSLVVALADEWSMEPRCSSVEYGRLRWRRATFMEDDRPLAATIEVVAITNGDAGPGEGQVFTRVWLADQVLPVSPLLAAPDAVPAGLPTSALDTRTSCAD